MLSIHKYKRIIILFILISFLAVVFLGSTAMMRGPNGDMQGECPFSVLGAPLCAKGTLPAVFHHISAYQSFFNISTHSNIIILLFYLLLIASTIFIFFIDYFLYNPPTHIRHVINSPPYIIHNKKILRWLSLFENSPSLS